jgi:hypothetical protein
MMHRTIRRYFFFVYGKVFNVALLRMRIRTGGTNGSPHLYEAFRGNL